MESPLRYQRWATGTVPDYPEVTDSLDTYALHDMWAPWIDLSIRPITHTAIRNVHHLGLPWSTGTAPDDDDPFGRPWFAILHAGGLRQWVIGQVRRPDLLTDDAAGDEADSDGMRRLRADLARPFADLRPIEQLRLVALLASLTASERLLDLPDPVGTDPITQHLRYERARALHQWDATNPGYAAVYADLAETAVEPALRVMSAAKVIAHAIRVDRRTEAAAPWLAIGARTLADLSGLPLWQEAMVASRYHRAAALYFHRTGQAAQTVATLKLAADANAVLSGLGLDNPVIAQLWREDRRIILESTVKSRIGTDPDSLREAREELDALDPAYPSSQFFLGELFRRAGRLAEAARHFERSGQGGGVRGAMSAFRAYECYLELGDRAAAARCLRLLHDLDPAVNFAAYAADAPTTG
jgi:tetratricopeptide (TPR) repeat protein